MKNLSEEIKKNLIEYHRINSKRNQLLENLQIQFRPLVEEAYENRHTMRLVDINQTLPQCQLHDDVLSKIKILLNQ